jgi:NAD(P)-dependent dehydrogenase (short-subunit alcohol dehydrogenase family)
MARPDPGPAPVGLGGQVALVTGGGRGLGRAFALGLAGAGARVAVTARTAAAVAETVQMIERAGGSALAVPGDIGAPDTAAHAVRVTEARLGPLDILVNNAGSRGPIGHDWDVDPDDWWRTLEVNLRGPYLLARAVLPGMIARRRGRIVNVSSGGAFNRIPQLVAYCASKAALTQWTHCLAPDVRPHGVSVFAFGPGFVHTPMTADLTTSAVPKETADFYRVLVDERRDTPIERVVETLLLLVSGRADALSGRYIQARDDVEALVRRAEQIRRDNLHTLTVRT